MAGTEVIALDDPRAVDAGLAGAKAANLARCSGLDVPISPGFVLTTEGVEARRRGGVPAELQPAWDRLGGDETTLVVRSSSTVEDAGTSSMAGQFTSVLDVRGWDAFVEAVDAVIASAARVGDPTGGGAGPLPIAVLVQRQIDARLGGVMFGVDPVTGDRRHVVLDVVPSRPDDLVGGTATAGHVVLTRRGRTVSTVGDVDAALDRRLRRRLAALAARAEERFGCPQDVEWAVDVDGRLWLLQSRPVTAVAAPEDGDVVLGPGPVAETFPDPLSPLEQDLFLPPLRSGIVDALVLTGAASTHRADRSPVLVAVGGWAAVDLRLLGLVEGHAPLWQRISPAALVRHVAVAWRVGRTRVALPVLADDVVDAVDAHLAALPRLDLLAEDELVGLVERARRELATVHRMEVLAGMLLHGSDDGTPVGAVALDALARAGSTGAASDVVAREPAVLALTAPAVGRPPVLPGGDVDGGRARGGRDGSDVEDLGRRDGLRLRTRWLQELLARAADELGRRLAAAGHLERPDEVRHLRWDDLATAVRTGAAPRRPVEVPPGPPLPAAFRLATDGSVRAVRRHHGDDAVPGGVAAGGGRAAGTVRHRLAPASETAPTVLVVRHLEPGLAPLLPGLAGLVAETGSALSHLAILARESGVATVVGVEDALRRFPPGSEILVDGGTGEVRLLPACAS
jgi:pyruvate,water dikinase